MARLLEQHTAGRIALVLALVILLGSSAKGEDPGNWEAMREEMVRAVKADMSQVRTYVGIDKLSDAVIDALNRVERHRFVPDEYRPYAYDNSPLPIGEGQTISQPFIVALMTELLEVNENSRVLEVGTGSGYQAAVLAEIVDRVYTVEIVGALAEEATARLAKLGYANVDVRQGDGTLGWPEEAPFDGIIVTAAGIEIPPSLLEQLAVGAHLVIPIGAQYDAQQLMVITRNADGSFTERKTIPVRFVPITGKNAEP